MAIIRFALPGVAREDRVPLIAYAARLLCLSRFFETRLWLVTAPLLLSNVRYSADGA